MSHLRIPLCKSPRLVCPHRLAGCWPRRGTGRSTSETGKRRGSSRHHATPRHATPCHAADADFQSQSITARRRAGRNLMSEIIVLQSDSRYHKYFSLSEGFHNALNLHYRRAMITVHESVPILLSILLIANVLTLVIAEEEVAAETPRSPSQSPAPTAKGLRGYSRFHANDSLVGLTVPCTHDEKVCFRYNQLLHAGHHCRPIGYGWVCDLRVNRSEFKQGSGHVAGTCKVYEDPCPGYRMAYDGRCHRKEVVRDVICGCDAEPTSHFLGGKECRCTPPTPIHVEQPEEEGRCRIPDFRFPNNNPNIPYSTLDSFGSYRLNCSSENLKCFSEGKVWVPKGNGCFYIRERGPCAEDHIVVLDAVAAREEGRAEAVCAHEGGGCPQGHVRIAIDGQCYAKRDLLLIISGFINTNAFGETSLTKGATASHAIFVASHFCALDPMFAAPGLTENAIPFPLCGANDKSQCPLFEVESDIPKPE